VYLPFYDDLRLVHSFWYDKTGDISILVKNAPSGTDSRFQPCKSFQKFCTFIGILFLLGLLGLGKIVELMLDKGISSIIFPTLTHGKVQGGKKKKIVCGYLSMQFADKTL